MTVIDNAPRMTSETSRALAELRDGRSRRLPEIPGRYWLHGRELSKRMATIERELLQAIMPEQMDELTPRAIVDVCWPQIRGVTAELEPLAPHHITPTYLRSE